MRHLGNLPDQRQAERFVAHLLTQGVHAKLDPAGDQWAVWVHDEDAVPLARTELESFQQDPDHPRYQHAEREAERLLQQRQRQREAAARNVVEMRGRWKSGHAGVSQPAPWTITLILLSIAASLLTDFTELKVLRDPSDPFSAKLLRNMMYVNLFDYVRTGDPLVNIKQGQVWRTVTPIFLHGDMLHLAFNMIWLFQLGRLLEWKLGPWKLLLFVVGFAAISSTANALAPMEPRWLAERLGSGPIAVGMSGVVYGLFGFVWMQSLYNPAFGVRLSQITVVIMIGWLIYCFLPISQLHVANVAHLAGLAAGVVAGRLPGLGR